MTHTMHTITRQNKTTKMIGLHRTTEDVWYWEDEPEAKALAKELALAHPEESVQLLSITGPEGVTVPDMAKFVAAEWNKKIAERPAS